MHTNYSNSNLFSTNTFQRKCGESIKNYKLIINNTIDRQYFKRLHSNAHNPAKNDTPTFFRLLNGIPHSNKHKDRNELKNI